MSNITDIKLSTRDQIKDKWFMLLLADFIFGILVQVPFLGSIAKIGLVEIHEDVSNGENVQIDKIFSWFNSNWWKPFVLQIVKIIVISIGLLFFILPGIYLAISYQYAIYILRENPDMEITACLKESRRLVSRNFTSVFIFPFTFILWFIGILLTAGILGIYAFPYYEQAHYNFFKNLTDNFDPTASLNDYSDFGL